MTKIQLLRGFRDFYPEDLAVRFWLFAKMRQVSQKFGYQEYEGPILEPLSLYAAKSGEELVKKQAFVMTSRDGEKIALRPELTPTLARMVAQKQAQLPKPIRWFSIGPRWRYEKPQKGRTREFYQWDIDLLGVEAVEADAEIIAIACEFFAAAGLSPGQVVIKVNNRRFMEQKLAFIEIPQNKIPQVISAIDKKDKMPAETWKKWLKELGLTDLQIKDLKGILEDKDFAGESEELTKLFATLTDLGVKEWVEFDPTVVRGLDYYTGTVFEGRDRAGRFRAILGGGRYDNLVEVVGGPRISGVGFAAGDKVVEEVLREFNLWPQVSSVPTQVLVTVFAESLWRNSLSLASKLREAGIATELYLTPTDLDKQLKYADR
ncbi:MAG: histidine--tRNA ligase, partial [Patescibacteria group bacterium]